VQALEVNAELVEADVVQLVEEADAVQLMEEDDTAHNSVAKMEAAQRERRGGAAATNHHTVCLHGIEKKHDSKKMSIYFAELAHEDFTRELTHEDFTRERAQ
jgi:hypothetical protein